MCRGCGGRHAARPRRRVWGIGFGICLSAVLGGCADVREPLFPTHQSRVFYPAAGGIARLQFVKSLEVPTGFRQLGRTASPPVADRSGTPVFGMASPSGVAMDEWGIYVCDPTLGVVHVFDMRSGGGYESFGREGGQHALLNPVDIAIGPRGDRYVADAGRGRFVVFDTANRHVRTFGNPERSWPRACVIVGDELIALDVKDAELERWDILTGRSLGTFAKYESAAGPVIEPVDLATDLAGNVYLLDAAKERVLVFGPDGTVAELMDIRDEGCRGQASRHQGIAVAPDGFVYVADAACDVVHAFDPETQSIVSFGNTGAQPGRLAYPVGIAVSAAGLASVTQVIDPSFAPEYLIVVVSQSGGPRVNLYAWGHPR